jgi:hypothetical protein
MTVLRALRMCQIYVSYTYLRSTPVAALSNAWVCRRSFSGTAGLNPKRDVDICLLWFFSGRGPCVGLITRLEESYRVWCAELCMIVKPR